VIEEGRGSDMASDRGEEPVSTPIRGGGLQRGKLTTKTITPRIFD
jgi:hypothetical protein